MNTDDLILVSVDDHVVEPPDMFDGHIPARFTETKLRKSSPSPTAPTPGSSKDRRRPTSA